MRLLLGATSCTFEGTLLENARYMASQVDDIELILYNCRGEDNFLSPSEIEQLNRLAEAYNVGYTIHLPSSLGTVEMDSRWLKKAVNDWRRGVECTLALHPRAYVWHWEAEKFGNVPSDDLGSWHNKVREAAERFLHYGLVPPELLCVENLSFAYRLIYEDVVDLGLSVCLDMGHWWRFTLEDELWPELLPRTKVIHLHGVDRKQERDHLAFGAEDECYWRKLATVLKNFEGDRELILTLEVFNYEHWQSCQRHWTIIWKEGN